jgi:nucleoside-diphosphate-sugar epimerase
VGDGSKLVDATYIDNAAMVHLLAADRLGADAACAGKAYYISNGEPWPMARIINGILAAAGLPRVTRNVPPALAYALGAVLEAGYAALRLSGEPIMTRFVARQLATAHWYDISAARRDLGYCPTVSMDEGMKRLGESSSMK